MHFVDVSSLTFETFVSIGKELAIVNITYVAVNLTSKSGSYAGKMIIERFGHLL